MTKIAYKVSQGSPNLPDGFITDHFQTDKDTVEGYQVATQQVFEKMLEYNVTLFRNWEASKGIVTADSTLPAKPARPAQEAEPVPPDVKMAATKAAATTAENAKLFQEFIAWKTAQGK